MPAVDLLHLISTPVPILGTLGLELDVGLSSEDPVVGRNASEEFHAYLSVYSRDGKLLDRLLMGRIPPSRRRWFPVSLLARNVVPSGDHLVVVHRIPSRFVSHGQSVSVPAMLEKVPDYSMWRAVIQYSYPGMGNGSVIYETPPKLNVRKLGAPPSATLTFTSKAFFSERTTTVVVPIHYSMDPNYTSDCRYHYALFSPDGTRVVKRTVVLPPFSVLPLDLKRLCTPEVVDRYRDPGDGMACLTFLAYSDDAALAPLILNLSPQAGGVSVEHTHPAQAFLLPRDGPLKNQLKASAITACRDVLFK